MVNGDQIQIKEIQIKKVVILSSQAREEVNIKLQKEYETNPDFNFQGYAKVSYTEDTPLSVFSVDPIEGDILNVFSDIMRRLRSQVINGI